MIGEKRIRTYAMRFIAGVLVLLAIMSIPIIASAVGDPNMGGGGGSGGGTGGGTSTNKWPTQNGQTLDGVRVSVYKGSTKVGKTVDFSNFTKVDGTAMKNISHFGQKSKKEVMKDKKVTYRNGNYAVVKPASSRKLPKIVKGNISEIRRYFIGEAVVKDIAKETGVNYSTMVNDSSYQLMIEPIIYVIYNGYPYAMTATEIGYFNDGLGNYKKGHLRNNGTLQRILFDNVPNAIYLEKDAFGIKKWTGATSGYQSESNVKNRLGVGAVSFKGSGLGSKIETQVVAMANNPNWNEGDKAKIGVVFMNNGSSTRVFPITIWVGDGINKGKAEAYKIEDDITIGAGQTYMYWLPDTVTMRPWITTVTARINWKKKSKETDPSNNEQTFALNVKKKDTVETRAEIVDVRVYRDGEWQYLSDLPASQRILNEGERISPRVKFTNTSTSQTKFQTEVWVGDGLGTGPLIEHLIWENGQAYNPSRPSNNRPTAPPLYSIGAGRAITTNVQAGTIGYPVKATDTDITARINYPNRAQETNPNNNIAIRKIQVRPRNQTVETSVESVKAYNQHGKEVTQFISGQTYTIRVTYRNDSSDQTSFPVRLAFGATVPPGSGTAVSGSGTKTIAKGGGKYVLTTTYKATGTSTLHWQASINWGNRMIETNTSNNFIAGTFKTVASAPVVETRTHIQALEVKRGVPGGGMAWIDYKLLKEGGAAPYQPLTEGEEVRVRVQYYNHSTSRTSFYANLYIGDGVQNLDPDIGPILVAPMKEFKLWQNGKQLTKLDEDAPNSWTIPIQTAPQTVITTHQYKVRLGDCAITSRINNTNKLEEENPNDNEDIYRFTVRPNSKIETSITNISVTDLDDVPVARLLEGDTYKVKAFFKNDSEKLTSFPITISTAAGNLVSTNKTISLGGTAQHEVTFTVPENSNNTITFYSDINYANRAQETNPNNNRMSITYEVIGNDLSAEFIEPNSAYREGVEVISSFYVYNHGITNIVPTHNLDIKLSAYFYDDDNQKIELQTELLQDHIVPAIGNNLAYFKWTVPEKKAAKDGKVYIECIVDPEEQFKDPDRDNNHVIVERPIKTVKISQTPMTKYERGPEPTWSLKGSSFRPRMNEFTSLRKTEFIWEEWVWENNWFAKNEYSVAIDNKAKAELEPDTHSPSREEQQNGKWMMRSGYGHYVRYVPDYVVNAPNNAWTEMQNATVHFPDLEYSSKFGEYATLEKDEDIWQLLPHPQSKYDEKLHFTKLWFPDGDYTVLTYAYDIWTPAGMVNNFVRSKEMLIDGSMYDDWGVIRK